MRLGQFARKYDIRVQDLISYMESDTKEEIHSNTKLSDETEADILDFFGLDPIDEPVVMEEPEVVDEEPETSEEAPAAPEEPTEEPEELMVTEQPKAKAKPTKKAKAPKKVEEETEEDIEWDAEDSGFTAEKPTPALPETPMDDIALAEGELADPMDAPPKIEAETPIIEESKEPEPTPVAEEEAPAGPADDEVIQTDKLLEMLESEDAPAGLDKIKLIKASKRELSGLKVLGKVELPEPPKPKEKEPKKEVEKKESDIVTEKDLREYRYPNRKKRAPLTPEEKEKRRQKAKRKKEEYEARQEKRRKEAEAQKLKELRESHYKQKLEQQQIASKKAKQKVKNEAVQAEVEAAKPAAKKHDPKPKTVVGKVWRWLNSH